jgi:hypothetical protein
MAELNIPDYPDVRPMVRDEDDDIVFGCYDCKTRCYCLGTCSKALRWQVDRQRAAMAWQPLLWFFVRDALWIGNLAYRVAMWRHARKERGEAVRLLMKAAGR